MITLLLSLCAVFTIATATTGNETKFKGRIQFFQDIEMGGRQLGSIELNKANRCYNFNCANLNDAISSAKWWGLPAKATYKGGTDALVVFYAQYGCKGKQQSFPTFWGGFEAFSDDSFNDMASSFMLLQYSTKIENGTRSVCHHYNV